MKNMGLKIVLSLLIVISIMFAGLPDALANNNVRVQLDGEYADIYPAPIIVDNRTLVPIRAISEMLGASVEWQDSLRQVVIEAGDTTFTFSIGSDTIIINDGTNSKDITIDVPAQIINGRTFVPLRFVAENLGVDVDFQNGIVVMTSEASPQENAQNPGTNSASTNPSTELFTVPLPAIVMPPRPNQPLDFESVLPIIAPTLEGFFAGGVAAPHGGRSTAAFLVDVDGNGTPGVLAIRYETGEGGTGRYPLAILYTYRNGILSYFILGYEQDFDPNQAIFRNDGFNSFATFITDNGRPVMVGRGNSGYMYYGLLTMGSNNRIEMGFAIAAEIFTEFADPRDYLEYTLFVPGSYGWNGMIDNRRVLTLDEFNAIRMKHGLDRSLRSWRDMADQSEQILNSGY